MKHIIFILIICFSVSGIADQNSNRANIYYQDEYVEASNNIAFKLNGFWSFPNAETNEGQSDAKKIKYGYGANASLSVFIASGAPLPSVAIEVGLGAGNYHWADQKDGEELYIIPAYSVAKLYLAPYGGINPYIGLGGYMAYIHSAKKDNAIGVGTLLQGGIDFIGIDSTIYNLDVKKYFGSNNVNYAEHTAKISPLIISIGIGFKF